MTEFDQYGELNPFQDPSRGRLPHLFTDDTGAGTLAEDNILHNLSGPESIMGRSIILFSSDDLVTPITCCNISREAPPVVVEDPEDPVEDPEDPVEDDHVADDHGDDHDHTDDHDPADHNHDADEPAAEEPVEADKPAWW